ncbi:antirepressor [Chryseobacterium contaminans]|uniref:Antirepressor n=1 Tax=Chryseobacterium contaminans TaxID=1423959 RepID=A0A1M7G6Z0_9FLAO|nr:M56 family metallopeptidase [Chryseobacterium contaminans]OCA69234.1 antirepressor [Chryseobacterium contaminans]SHM11946.1 Signal transducer regulating beta-lactamase production, contains metallopeptidase domain [Chryseobacterium contaminans]
METLLLYFGKVILCSGVMFLYYQLSLKDKTFHHYNRFYLLLAIVISLLLPLIKVDDFTIEVNSDVYLLLDKIQNFNTPKNVNNGNLYFNLIFSALGLVSLYFLGKLIYGIFKIQQFKAQFQKESFDGINFYRTDLTEAPFSYFKNLFWKNTITLDSAVGKQILKHEMVHIEQKHSFDKIFIEVVTAVFWFNPFFHIIKREISLIHEYLADKKAVKNSDTKAFAQMLLASHFSGTQLPAASPFLSSNLKKRLKMLQKPKTKFGYARRILALPVLFTVAFAYLVNAKNREIEETNLSVKKALTEIKNDTVKEKIQQKEKTGLPDPEDSNKQLAELQKKMKEKQQELSKLDPDSKAFEKKMEEIDDLASTMAEITAESSKQVDEYFNSPEWKKQMEDLENMDPLDKKELRKIERQAAKAAKEAQKIGKKAAKLGADAAEIGRIAAEKARIEVEKSKIDIEAAKKAAEQAKVIAEQARQDAEIATKNMSFTTINSSPKVMVLQADFIKKDGNGNITMQGVKKYNMKGWDNIKYFIDGVEASKEQVQALKPENIASMNVIKENAIRGTQNEIRIQTKK